MAFAATLYRETRSTDRHAVALEGTLRNPEWQAFDASVLDLSVEGFRVAASASLAAGSAISLGLPGLGARGAVVVRADVGEYGCRFDQRLTADELAATVVAVANDPVPLAARLTGELSAPPSFPDANLYSQPARAAWVVGASLACWGVIVGARVLIG